MLETTNEVLRERMEHIIQKMDEGFTGVHSRQDKTNGAVADNTKYRLEHKQLIDDLRRDRASKYKRYGDLFWKLGTAILAGGWGINTILPKIIGG